MYSTLLQGYMLLYKLQ